MPSNKKKRIEERMKKTGESYSTALRNLRAAISPKLPTGPTSTSFDTEGRALPDDGSHPQFELVDIDGDFDPNDLKTAWVSATAFHDPSMPKNPSWPPNVERVLNLAEYIDARAKQTGWRLAGVQPGPLVFMGKTLNVLLLWDTHKERDGRRS